MASWRSKNPSIPYRFSWFVEGKLAGMAYPDEATIDYLAESGIKTLVNLTEEPATYERRATDVGIKCCNVRVECFGPPSLDQVAEVVRLIDEVSGDGKGGAVGIHCAMGCGRTGTMLACYLVSQEGYSADEAIDETRRRRKGSIENKKQEQAVRDYEKHLKSMQ